MFDILNTGGAPWWWPMLAAVTPDDAVSGKVVVAIITAIFTGLAGIFGGKKWGEAKKVQIDQPFLVRLQEEFLSREDFKEYKKESRAEMDKTQTLLRAMGEKVESKHLELLATIELAAKTGRDGRVAIWDELKPMGKDLAALKATSDVAAQLSKLAEVLKQPPATRHA